MYPCANRVLFYEYESTFVEISRQRATSSLSDILLLIILDMIYCSALSRCFSNSNCICLLLVGIQLRGTDRNVRYREHALDRRSSVFHSWHPEVAAFPFSFSFLFFFPILFSFLSLFFSIFINRTLIPK